MLPANQSPMRPTDVERLPAAAIHHFPHEPFRVGRLSFLWWFASRPSLNSEQRIESVPFPAGIPRSFAPITIAILRSRLLRWRIHFFTEREAVTSEPCEDVFREEFSHSAGRETHPATQGSPPAKFHRTNEPGISLGRPLDKSKALRGSLVCPGNGGDWAMATRTGSNRLLIVRFFHHRQIVTPRNGSLRRPITESLQPGRQIP